MAGSCCGDFSNETTSPQHELRGFLPVFQTPWHNDETLGFDTLEREIAWNYDASTDGMLQGMKLPRLEVAQIEAMMHRDSLKLPGLQP